MRVVLGLLAGWLLVALPAQAVVDVHSEQDLLSLFLQRNLLLIAGRAEVELAQAEILIARQLPNPSVSAAANRLGSVARGDGTRGGYWQQPHETVLRVEQLIEAASKRQLRREGAELGAQAQVSRFHDLVRALTRSLRQAYYTVSLAQRRVAIYDELLVHMNEILHANTLRWKAGDISETEFQRSELEVLKARSDVESAHLELDKSRQQLAELIGHSLPWQGLVVPDVFPARSLPAEDVQLLLEKAYQQRGDLKAASALYEQRDKQTQLAELLKVPDVTLGVQYVRDPSAPIADGVGVGVSVTLPLWHGHEGEVAQAKAARRLSELSWQQLRVAVETEVLQAVSALRQKQSVLSRYDSAIIHRARSVRQASSLAYRQGAISLLELLDAERSYRNLMLDYAQALFDQTSAWLDLMYTLGEEDAT